MTRDLVSLNFPMATFTYINAVTHDLTLEINKIIHLVTATDFSYKQLGK